MYVRRQEEHLMALSRKKSELVLDSAPLTIDRDHPIPPYLQLKEQLRMQILTHQLQPGTSLPGVRTMAATLNVNFNTILKTLQELRDEGLIEMTRGRNAKVSTSLGNARELRRELIENLVERVLEEAGRMGIAPADLVGALAARTGTVLAGQLQAVFIDGNISTAERYAKDLAARVGIRFVPLALPQLQERFEEFRDLLATSDLAVTPVHHRPEVEELLLLKTGRTENLYTISMGPILETAMRLLKYPGHYTVGVIGSSEEDARVLRRSISQVRAGPGVTLYAGVEHPAKVQEVLAQSDVVVISRTTRQRLTVVLPEQLQVVDYPNDLDQPSVDMLRSAIRDLQARKQD